MTLRTVMLIAAALCLLASLNAAQTKPRETYKFITADEFIEVFELAEPGKDFERYTENRYRRKK